MRFLKYNLFLTVIALRCAYIFALPTQPIVRLGEVESTIDQGQLNIFSKANAIIVAPV